MSSSNSAQNDEMMQFMNITHLIEESARKWIKKYGSAAKAVEQWCESVKGEIPSSSEACLCGHMRWKVAFTAHFQCLIYGLFVLFWPETQCRPLRMIRGNHQLTDPWSGIAYLSSHHCHSLGCFTIFIAISPFRTLSERKLYR